MATGKEGGAVGGRGGGEINTNKEVSCLKMEQAGIPQEIRLRFRRRPRSRPRPQHRRGVTRVISEVRRRNPMSCLSHSTLYVLKTFSDATLWYCNFQFRNKLLIELCPYLFTFKRTAII